MRQEQRSNTMRSLTQEGGTMKQHRSRRAHARTLLCVSMTLGAVALASSVWADGLKNPDAESMKLLGHSDMQNRPIYQPTVHKYPSHTVAMGSTPADAYANKTIFFAGLHAATGGGGCVGSLPNPLNGGACEKDGTLIVDATNPSNPFVIKHLPPTNPANSLAQMVRVCDGQTGKLGQTGHVYMLRNDGSGGGNGQHDVYDVTDPVHPLLLSVPVSGLTATHKSWWECETGIAWIVAGANAPQAANPDGWNTNQHMKLFDLSDPAHPVYIRDIGLVGQNPGSSATPTSTGVHGPLHRAHQPADGRDDQPRVHAVWHVGARHVADRRPAEGPSGLHDLRGPAHRGELGRVRYSARAIADGR